MSTPRRPSCSGDFFVGWVFLTEDHQRGHGGNRGILVSTSGWVAALRGSHKWLNAAKELPPASWGHLDTALKAASGLRGAEILSILSGSH